MLYFRNIKKKSGCFIGLKGKEIERGSEGERWERETKRGERDKGIVGGGLYKVSQFIQGIPARISG